MSDESWWKTLIKKASVATLTAGAVLLIVISGKPDEKLVYFIAGSAATYLWGKTQGG